MPSEYVIITGGYDTRNVGDYAMLDHFVSEANKRGFATKILSRHNDKILIDRYKVKEIIENYEYGNKQKSVGNFFRGFNFGDDTKHLEYLASNIVNSSGLYIGGGRLLIDYTDDVMRGPLAYFSTLVTLCQFLNVPVHIYAMTIVPVKSEMGMKSLKFIIENCKTVTVRDEKSKAYLKDIGCQQTNISVLPDPAFALKSQLSPLDNKNIAISVRHIHEGWGGMTEEDYFKKMSSIISGLKSNRFNVVGIPHQYYGIDTKLVDDRNIFFEISKSVDFEWVEEEWLDIDKYFEFYSNVSVTVGVRRHSFIMSACCGVPVVALSENPNASRAVDDFNGEPAIDIQANPDLVLAKVMDVFERRFEIANRQLSAIREIGVNLKNGYSDVLFNR